MEEIEQAWLCLVSDYSIWVKILVFLFCFLLIIWFSNVLSVFVPQETQEAKKSFSKKDEERVLSGREKRLAEQVSSYNVSQGNKICSYTFFLSFNALHLFFFLFLFLLHVLSLSQSFTIHLSWKIFNSIVYTYLYKILLYSVF